MRENRLYGSVGGWGLNRPPPTQSIARTTAQEDRTTIARTAPPLRGPHHLRAAKSSAARRPDRVWDREKY